MKPKQFAALAASCALFALTSTATLGSQPTTETASISLSLNDAGELVAQYLLPPGCGEFQFLDRKMTAEKLRSQWVQAEPDRAVRRPPGSLLRKYTIKPQVVNMDRVYPPVLPIAPGSVLIYPRYFALSGKCGNGSVKVTPPKGGVAIHRTAEARTRDLRFSLSSEDNRHSFLYVGGLQPTRIVGGKLLEGSDLPPFLSATIQDVVAALTRKPGNRSTREAENAPLIVATWVQETGKNSIDAHGDVAGGATRLTFYGDSSKTPSESDLVLVKGTIAHEFAHLAQPSTLAKLPNREMVSEGEAEVIRWLTLLRLGLVSERDFWAWTESVVNKCNVLVDGRGWREIRAMGYGEFPYVCGAATIVLSALEQRVGNSLEEDIWRRRKRIAEATNSCVEAYFEATNPHACNALPSASFFSGEMSFPVWVAKVLNASATPQSETSTLPTGLKAAYAETVFMKILELDCGTRVGFSGYSDRFVLDAGLNCKSMPDGFVLSAIGDVNLLEEPQRAAETASRTCAAAGRMQVGHATGRTVEVSCASFDVRPISLYRLTSQEMHGRPLLMSLPELQWKQM